MTQFAPIVLFAGVVIMLFERNVRYGASARSLEAWYPAFRHGTDVGGGRPLRSTSLYRPVLPSRIRGSGLVAGLAVTAIIQSSSATGIIQAFAMQGSHGARFRGVCDPGSISGPASQRSWQASPNQDGRCTAVALLFFNIIGAFIFAVAMRFCPLWTGSNRGRPARL